MKLMEEEEKKITEEEEEQVWWSWGAGTEGQLGTGRFQDEHLPQLLPSLSSSGPISLLSCGGAHVIALTTSGKVLTWGRGTSGQLGHGDLVNSLQPKPLEVFKSTVVTHVSAGWNHSGFVSDTGCLFTCGDGSFGQLGHCDYKSHSFPVKVSYFASKHVEQIACGMRHSLVLLKGHSRDQVYGFGSGKRGQLGICKDKIGSINVPQVTLGLGHVKITSICANGDHSAALSADGNLYIWGRGFSGTSNDYYPQCLTSSLSFTQAALGWNHALGLTGDGEVHMLGGDRHGELSKSQKMTPVKHLSEGSKEAIMEKIPGIDMIKVLEIAAGAEHSALITENGLTMTWGWGEHGQLGLGNTSDQSNPQMVRLGHICTNRHTTFKVYCGSGFTFAVRKDRLPSRT
ncbi:ultraviolet-B receptor UVR8 [Cornus florida]|uniref:ultraviolet-B receptor UVR8 n=1 Tax=Cornus florida TaxID=4283 RepID=UPI00289B1CCB|nr:ultraviolet-B receptor UVR8 [Cornus florida]